jgi:hypothetical protein
LRPAIYGWVIFAEPPGCGFVELEDAQAEDRSGKENRTVGKQF